ncbi:MAG: GatB/YqeY domain-containing protein [Deltaproteobacteria bacterium]|nr:GatB/YqeY domain-containing protein [Deltaproteobacteria bacterium]
MSLTQQITEDLKVAMKAKDQIRMSCLRMLKTALKNRQIEIGHELKDEEVQPVISSLIRKGQEAAKEFKKGGRDDLAAKEEEEIKVFYGYLPQQLKPDEIEKVLKEIISELSATGPKDLGKVMKVAMARMEGKAQGREVNEIARRMLS